MGRATYDGPPGQDVKEPFQVCEPPSDGHDGFVEEAGVVLKGFAKPRGEVHRDGDWHRSVHIWVVHPASQQLVLQKRSMSKDTHPGLWDVSSAGHITGSDDVSLTAIRELEEELGLEGFSAEQLSLLFVCIADNTSDTVKDREYQWVYLLEVTDIQRLSGMDFGSSEVDAVKLLPVADYQRGLAEKDATLVPRPLHYQQRFFATLQQRFAAA